MASCHRALSRPGAESRFHPDLFTHSRRTRAAPTRFFLRRPPKSASQQAGAASTSAATAEFDAFEAFILAQQDAILAAAEALDGSGRTFLRDRWSRGDANAGAARVCVCGGVWVARTLPPKR